MKSIKKSQNLRKNKENYSSLNLGSTQLLYGTSQTKKTRNSMFHIPVLITNLQAMKSGTTTTSYLFYITLYED